MSYSSVIEQLKYCVCVDQDLRTALSVMYPFERVCLTGLPHWLKKSRCKEEMRAIRALLVALAAGPDRPSGEGGFSRWSDRFGRDKDCSPSLAHCSGSPSVAKMNNQPR